MLFLKTDVNVLSKSNKPKTFFGIMSATDKKSRFRIRKSVVRIPGSASVPKCHVSTTLLNAKVHQKRHQELRRVQKRKKAIEGKREKRRKRKRGKRRGFTPSSRSSTSKALLPGRLSTH